MSKYVEPQNKSFPELEEEILKFWKDNDVFKKSVESRPENNLYVFYDGPPFISGLPHYGHLLGSIAKDIIPRYWTMKGKRVKRVWGWDAHGLTVENKVQKELGIQNRRDIESFGLDEFTKACYEYTSKISSEWSWYIDRIGRWVDMDHAYKTLDQTYMESVMWAFKELHDKGLIYEGVRTSLYCTVCGTPVSNFEIAMDNSYKDVEDPAITVKFKIKTSGEFEGVYLLAWTTTPWTIPSNRALVVNSDASYIIVEYDGSKYLVAKERVGDIFKDLDIKIGSEFSIKGSDLANLGLEYEPPYKFYKGDKDKEQNEFKIYSDLLMANVSEGTGIVHCAPGFGEIDTELGQNWGLTIMMSIDDEGNFVQGDVSDNPYVGMFYKKADKYIVEDLKNRNLLFKADRIVHRFPYHDRCNTNLIQKAQSSWFVNVAALKEGMVKTNEHINWVPEHLKHGRFGKNIEMSPDWCISRSRFWATPMPVWESSDGDRIVVSSIKEIEELSGQKVKDLHRPYIDEIIIKKDGKEYKRRSEVLDSWFEAGSMPYAQIHYPFENKEEFEKNFPGDYIVEYVGQVRAWFHVMHVLSNALFKSNSFKNVISTGVMAGNDGRKMSKSYGNYTDPKEILQTVGGDALRLYLMNSPLMLGGDSNFDDNELKNKSRNVLNPLWNSAKYFLIYAKLNDWDPSKLVDSNNILDRWIISRLHETIKGFSKNIEKYQVPSAVKPIEDFSSDLSNWYVRRSRDRISVGDNEALSTLYTVLSVFAKASAPIIPFLSEKIYQSVCVDAGFGDFESVHLCNYPSYNEKLMIDSADMEIVKNISALGNAIRKEKMLPIRQPLTDMTVYNVAELSDEYVQIILDELNIKAIKFERSDDSDEVRVTINTNITDDLLLEGISREIIREIQKLRKEAGVNWDDLVDVIYPNKENYEKAVKIYADDIKSKTLSKNLELGSEFSIKGP